MLNVEKDVSPPTQTYPLPGKQTPGQPQLPNLRPEEIKMYKDCVSSMYYKAGIPFAVFFHVLSSWKKPGGMEIIPKNYIKKGFMFFGNVILGSLLFTPSCYFKLVKMRTEFEKRQREMGMEEPSQGSEDILSTSGAEDFSYPTDVMTNLNEPDDNFSSDFNSSKLLPDDDKDIKTQSTTYDDLRARNRSRYASKTPVPASSLNFESETPTGIHLSPSDNPASSKQSSEIPPLRKVVKNKYGDEIE